MRFFPFASWESAFWRADLMQSANAENARYLMQLERLPHNRRSLFFRAHDSGDEASFVASESAAPEKFGEFVGLRNLADPSPAQLRAALDELLKKRGFARLFFLDASENRRAFDAKSALLLVVSAAGWGAWVRVSGEVAEAPILNENAVFEWTKTPDDARFLQTPAREIWAQIQAQKADENSDCGFARRFLDWPDEKRENWVWTCREGCLDDFKNLLRAALLNEEKLWENADALSWRVAREKQGGETMITRWNGDRPEQTLVAPKNLQEIEARVRRIFDPRPNLIRMNQHRCAFHWQRAQADFFDLKIQNPSAHERLEAMLQWREWTQTHPA